MANKIHSLYRIFKKLILIYWLFSNWTPIHYKDLVGMNFFSHLLLSFVFYLKRFQIECRIEKKNHSLHLNKINFLKSQGIPAVKHRKWCRLNNHPCQACRIFFFSTEIWLVSIVIIKNGYRGLKDKIWLVKSPRRCGMWHRPAGNTIHRGTYLPTVPNNNCSMFRFLSPVTVTAESNSAPHFNP